MCKHATNISFSNITEYKIILIAVFTVHRKTWNTFTADGFAIRQKLSNNWPLLCTVHAHLRQTMTIWKRRKSCSTFVRLANCKPNPDKFEAFQ
ncbi:hypothetical protein T12_14562 [Trichinella patagoniensis]|uniref:Uncharacterized protein n=1 Tax=Trichinella patagoniensis TaxID=990121 RepID=A0A0V1A2L5_9BILA|nr:hypothetical protein T12_14562 [Trichinella patagoniensis]KRZ92057.1 hypothetical protein T08_8932 [Trichinella sp. T8]